MPGAVAAVAVADHDAIEAAVRDAGEYVSHQREVGLDAQRDRAGEFAEVWRHAVGDHREYRHAQRLGGLRGDPLGQNAGPGQPQVTVLFGTAEWQHRAVIAPQVGLDLHPIHVADAHVDFSVRAEREHTASLRCPPSKSTFPNMSARLAFLLTALAVPAVGQSVVRVDVTPGHAINTFDPDSALGSSIDVLSRTDINRVYTPHIIQEALSAGWGPITYRNNTELRMAAWHWTENGGWSDVAHRRGYFTGSTDLKEPIRTILAYALPHRGFATSGDRPLAGPNLTHWKSNPYLTSRFTGESDVLHPKRVI